MMNSTLKNILFNTFAILAGILIGGAVNMIIITISDSIIPYPSGYNVTDMESMKATFHLLETKHFIMPWIAHAVGTLIGAILAVKIAKTNKLKFATIIGLFFLVGGTMMVFELPSPLWFNVVDLGLAYLPMAWLGYRIAK